MDDLVLHVQEEVALDGESGCSWSRFWFIVDLFLHGPEEISADPSASSASSEPSGSSQAKTVAITPKTPRIKRTDEKFRLFFWNNFVMEDGALFFNHSSGNAPEAKKTSDNDDDSEASFVPFSELAPLDHAQLSYANIMEKYRGTIRIVATAEQQRHVLLGYSGAGSQVSVQAFQILQTVAATRALGATQAQLAKLHKIDPRSMFHFLKVLIDMKLAVKIPVTTAGTYTLLCLHKKFASQNRGFKAMNSVDDHASAGRMFVTTGVTGVTRDGGRRFEGLLKSDTRKVSYYGGLIKQKLTDILGRAKNQVMSLDDLAKALDLMDMNVIQNRWFNRQVELLCKLKYTKRVQVPGIYRCVQLLRPYGVQAKADDGEQEHINLKSVIADDTPQSGITIDTSIEHQVYMHIMDAKNQGTIAKEIRQKMNMLNIKLLSKILDTLSKPAPGKEKALINRIVEFVGRERRYRYFSEQGFHKSIGEDHRDYIEKSKSLPVKVLPPRKRKPLANHPVSTDTQATRTASEPSTPLAPTAPAFETGSSLQPHNEAEGSESAPSSIAPESDLVATPASAASTRLPDQSQSATPERYISLSLLMRREVILSILERKRMMELQQALIGEYQEEKARLYPHQDENSVIDRKTLHRTINILESEGLLKLYAVHNIPMVHGGATSKSFCFHPSVDVYSEEVQNYMKECSNRHLLFGSLGIKPVQRAEVVNLEVESLDEMQQRLGKDFYKGPAVPAVPFADLSAVSSSKPKQVSRPKRVRGYEFQGYDCAAELGWNRAKMMRALVFHRFLLDKLGVRDEMLFGYASHANVLATSALFSVTYLRVFLIVVGVLETPCDESKVFLESNRNSNMPLSAVPEHTRPCVAPNYNFKKRLCEVFRILDMLGLVSPLSSPPGSGGSQSLEYASNHLVLNTHYEVLVNVRAPLDPNTPDQLDLNLKERKEYMLLAAKECREFWMDLQMSSSVMKYIPVANNPGQSWSLDRQDFLLNLCNKRLWAEPIRITNSQKIKLMTQVNTTIRFVPHPSDPKVDQMARETGLPRDHVVQFYKAITAVWHNHPIRQKPKRLHHVKRLRQSIVKEQAGADVAAMSTAEPSASIAHPEELKHNQEVGERFSVGRPRQRRAKRSVWLLQEDERLLLANAVTRSISETFNIKFSWQCISNAFHGERSRTVCRHRYTKLSREFALVKRVEDYRAQFSHILPSIAEKFGISRKLDDFDPSPILEYFRPSSDTPVPRMLKVTSLPATPAEIERRNYVRQTEQFSCLYLEDRLHPELSLPRRLLLLSQLPCTLRTSCHQELDNSPEELGKPRIVARSSGGEGAESGALVVREETLAAEHMILAIVKAVFNLPGPMRPKTVTRALLSGFQSSKVVEACDMAKEWKLLSMIRNASYRIPGQRVGRSERFSVLMNGAYPKRLTAAVAEVDRAYEKSPDRIFQANVSPAETMVFLNNIALGWLQLSMVRTPEGESTAYEEPYGQGAIQQFDVCLKNVENVESQTSLGAAPSVLRFESSQNSEKNSEKSSKKNWEKSSEDPKEARDKNEIIAPIMQRSPSESVVARALAEAAGAPLSEGKEQDPWKDARDQGEIVFKALVETLPTLESCRLYKFVYGIILDSCTSGMIPQDIKNALKIRGYAYTDKEIMDCLRALMRGSPPVILKVGMAYPRFVVFGWHQTWTVDYHVSSFDGAVLPIEWAVPRMWKRLNGAMNKSIFETSLHAVLTHIVDKPGISKGALLKHFYKLLLSVELDELTEELERRGAIEERSGIRPRVTTLFSKRDTFVRCDRDTIDEFKVTNYFAHTAYYRFLDMSLVVSSRRGRHADRALQEGHSQGKKEGGGGDEDEVNEEEGENGEDEDEEEEEEEEVEEVDGVDGVLEGEQQGESSEHRSKKLRTA